MSGFRRALALALLGVSSLAAQGTPEAPEPNASTTSAGALALGAQAFGVLDATGTDSDWFRITLGQTADLRAFTGPGLVQPVGDTLLALLDGNGAVLTEVDDGSLATHGFYSLLDFGALAAGTYYLRVRAAPTFTGSYTLDVIAAPPGSYVAGPPLQPVVERPEVNDQRLGGVPTATLLFSRNTGVIVQGGGGSSWSPIYAGSDDYDFYGFTVAAPGIITLATDAHGTAPAGDTVLHLIDGASTRLAFDDDSGNGAYSRLSHLIATPGTYYAVVNGFSAVNAGSYRLDILGPLPPLPSGAASVTMHPGGCPGTAGLPALGIRPNSFGFPARPEQPLLGSTFYLDIAQLPAGGVALSVLDLLPARTPLQLGPLGAPGCVLELDTATAVAGVLVATPAGVCFWGLRVPFVLELRSLPLEMQVVVLDAAANALGAVVSNRCSATCGISH